MKRYKIQVLWQHMFCFRQFTVGRTRCKRLEGLNDVKSSLKILKNDVFDGNLNNYLPCPRQADVAIIGGSVIGSSIAYFIKEKQNKMDVVVIEPDSTYSRASALLSVGGMRQQFTCIENIQMSQFGFEFLRHSRDLLAVEDELPPDVQFNHAGYLIMANEDQAEDMLTAHRLQIECGAKNTLLSNHQLKMKFPWINVEGVELASLGQQGEGWLDPAALLSALKGKAKSLGANYVNGRVIGFDHKDVVLAGGKTQKMLDSLLVQLPNGDIQPLCAPIVVNAAGAWAGEVAKMAGIGDANVSLDCSVPLPVEPRKRFVYTFHCPRGPGLDCPLVTDQLQGNVYFRREGIAGTFLCGKSPRPEDEPSIDNLDVDHSLFNETIWPELAYRVPQFEILKLKSAWAGFYDYNYVDHNLVIGNHPYFNNFIFANGSSGHGLQHSLAIGKAVTELIMYSEYRTMNLDRFSFERFLELDSNSSVSEKNIF